MKTVTVVSALAWSLVSFGWTSAADAQAARKFFFEGDLVRGVQQGAPGPFCVLANQFKRLEKVVWRIRVLDQTGQSLDEKGLKGQLNWDTVVGNRMTSAGWEETSRVVAEARADASGRTEFRFTVPDDLGGVHTLWVEVGGTKKQGVYWIAPTARPLDVTRGPVGTTFRVHRKGVGWSETANIYTVVYDNTVSGYACAFNSQGDIEIFMQATGEPGWHFIDLYPAIYKGKETRPNNYRLPQLTYADDHPGEDLPRFRFRLRSDTRCH